MDGRRKRTICRMILTAAVTLALMWHYLLEPWGCYRALPAGEAALRQTLVTAAEGWLDAKESDGSHRPIIDRYNSQPVLPLNYVVQYTDSWCAAFVTAAAMEAGLTDRIPPECGCQRQIGLLEERGRWQEDEGYVPSPGDLIYYDWDQTRPGDCVGWADHVGIVVGVKWPLLKVIEGNREDQVMYRILPVWDVTIRGYGMPDYAALPH